MKWATPLRFLLVSFVSSTDFTCSSYIRSGLELSISQTSTERTTWRSKTLFRRCCCLSSNRPKKLFPRSSASTMALSTHAMIPIICLRGFQDRYLQDELTRKGSYRWSLPRTESTQVLNSAGKKPNIKSIAPRTSFAVEELKPADRDAWLRKYWSNPK